MSTEVAGSKITEEQKVLRKVANFYNVKAGSVGGVLTSNNPAEQRRLTHQLQRIEDARKRRESSLTWNQRNFFIRQVFDQDNDLRFPKAEERPAYMNDLKPIDEEREYAKKPDKKPEQTTAFPKIKIRALGIFASGMKFKTAKKESSRLKRTVSNLTDGDIEPTGESIPRVEVLEMGEESGNPTVTNSENSPWSRSVKGLGGQTTKHSNVAVNTEFADKNGGERSKVGQRNAAMTRPYLQNINPGLQISKNDLTGGNFKNVEIKLEREDAILTRDSITKQGKKTRSIAVQCDLDYDEEKQTPSTAVKDKHAPAAPVELPVIPHREGTILDLEEHMKSTNVHNATTKSKLKLPNIQRNNKALFGAVRGETKGAGDLPNDPSMTEEDRKREKLLRRITRTLPTHLLLKTHERENQAGAETSIVSKKKRLLDNMRSEVNSKRALKDQRFKNVLDSLSTTK